MSKSDEPISDEDLAYLEIISSRALGEDPAHIPVDPDMLRRLIVRLRRAEEGSVTQTPLIV